MRVRVDSRLMRQWNSSSALGLCFFSHDYNNHSSKIGNYLKLFFGLPFLHPDDVQDFFVSKLLLIKRSDPTPKWKTSSTSFFVRTFSPVPGFHHVCG